VEGWKGPYARPQGGTLRDPYGNPFGYIPAKDEFTVICYGSDGARGGRGSARDSLDRFRLSDRLAVRELTRAMAESEARGRLDQPVILAPGE
jgi:hypothetical protein